MASMIITTCRFTKPSSIIQFPSTSSSITPFLRNPSSTSYSSIREPIGYRKSKARRRRFRCFSGKEEEVVVGERENSEVGATDKKIDGRVPFDLNLAVILAGFAFEAYRNPPEDAGTREVDAAECQTVFLSEQFLHQVYDGKLFVELKKGVNLPAMDPWGTSDPYVVIQFDSQVVKSKTKWATKEPVWNETFIMNMKLPPKKNIQVAAWDANLVTPHKRMGNAGISLESFCDGNIHEAQVELQGLGGGGEIHLAVKYKSFQEIDREQRQWRVPFFSDLFAAGGLSSAMKSFHGSENIQARQFAEFAFGTLRSLTGDNLPGSFSNSTDVDIECSEAVANISNDVLDVNKKVNNPSADIKTSYEKENSAVVVNNNEQEPGRIVSSKESSDSFWKNFADLINQSVEGSMAQNLGFQSLEKLKWDGFDMINRLGILSKINAEEQYVSSGLAAPETNQDDKENKNDTSPTNESVQNYMNKASLDMLKQTDNILGSLMVLAAAFARQERDLEQKEKNKGEAIMATDMDRLKENENDVSLEPLPLDQKQAEETKALFSTAESAMEAWAVLATSLGRASFIKSEFEKICFLDNPVTDTQVAIWCDILQRRLVVAFRGTEQSRWKDLRTDLMLVPAGLNPERIGGDFKQEVQVHSGFLTAYDSVRSRILSLIKVAIGFEEDRWETAYSWHVYVTGHSLGGALATLLALELSSSQMARKGAIRVTMYNFGSPRVGNKIFAEMYNEKVNDSWRVVNHRDIIPTVPRLMGYCHVAQPVYLRTRDLEDAMRNLELMNDGYVADVIGEYTPDVLLGEFMKGEKQLLEKILQTEISLFRSIRDGSALMQHMEDFYYVSLLESVKSNYGSVDDARDV